MGEFEDIKTHISSYHTSYGHIDSDVLETTIHTVLSKFKTQITDNVKSLVIDCIEY